MIAKIITLSASLLVSAVHAADVPVEDLLRQGLFEEEANRDFDKAAERYRSVVAAHDKQRALAATATYRLGEIARKKNDKEAAAAAFRTVVERFPEQEDLGRLSRENLTALGMVAQEAAEPGPGLPPVPPPMDRQDDEIARLKAIARNSPDLLDGADPSGWRPLHSAAKAGWVKVINYLLENKADINSRTTGELFTPLQIASIYGHLGAVNALVAAKADVNASFHNPEGSNFAMPTREQRAQNLEGDWDALDLAILYNRKEIVRALLKAKADLGVPKPRFKTLSDPLTPLMLAIYLDRDEITADLIAAGAPLSLAAGTDLTPLQMAVFSNPRMVAPLLKAGASPHTGSRKEGRTALHMAASMNEVELAKALIDAGADVKCEDGNRETPLHQAAGSAMFELLVSKGADPNAKSKDGRTPLEWIASREGDPGQDRLLFETLLRLGAKSDDPQRLQRIASRDMLQVVRERVVYPPIYQDDAILLSLDGRERFVRPVEKRPAPGSPPPSVEEVLCWVRGVTANPAQTNLSRVAVVRRDADGKFSTVSECGWKVDETKRNVLPPLQWGDIVEVKVTVGFNPGKPVLDAWVDDPPARDVTFVIDGIPFPQKLTGIGQMWLGNIDLKGKYWIPRTMDSEPDGTLVEPEPKDSRLSRMGDLPSAFIDSSRILVKRKDVEQPFTLDLGGAEAVPFRLADGDVVTFSLLPKMRERMEKVGRNLVLSSDLRFAGWVERGALLQALGRSGVIYPGLDWSRIRILDTMKKGKEERWDVAEWLGNIPERAISSTELRDVWTMRPGEWVILQMLPDSVDKETSAASDRIRDRLQSMASIMNAPQQFGVSPSGQIVPKVQGAGPELPKLRKGN